ncbi:ABC transporter permease [Streptomyces sp. TRM 70361]|uniref:ABC transporter permease n=1 Tax=Streptomyces sp. TRM 70361 TaxID=3116553 RepID=UPI002E7C04D7|nr:ABC transporter permease [Streptomyces sp. TRM 70361]MEE1939226.1 ABC transporter permease [Streptomyces sp. TRM 70361]
MPEPRFGPLPDGPPAPGPPAAGASVTLNPGAAGTDPAAGRPAGHGPGGRGGGRSGRRRPRGAHRRKGRRGEARSLWSDAWYDLRRNPVFLVSALLILFLVTVSLWPGLLTDRDPLSCDLGRSLGGPVPGHWFGFDAQGCDVYARTVYGARASIAVAVCATLGTALVGGTLGGLAGFFGGWTDGLLSRLTDVFFGIPIVLGGLVFLAMIKAAGIWPVVLVIVLLGWPQVARIARGSVVSVKEADYVQAARALGAGSGRVLLRHVLPNAVAPVIVVATIALGTYVALEATLSFLGIGLQPPTVSWGVAISNASDGMQFRNAPHILLYPAAALSVTVLAFIMLGDAVRDALDPKLR